MQLTVEKDGTHLNRYCPFQEEQIYCGDWCSLCVVTKHDTTNPLFKNRAYTVDLMCSPREHNYVFKEEDIVNE